ncbi:type II secretion system F family protein [Streptacidiphilus neutrinimicus]|uniref:type II secretion system F family protein n=1 Tax=Streptacidiphilus neutrinimicus TaxID=105420 RepID=UPI0006943D69|nr:type II secretion system F family protein [Streptacidiphilus neutrinimicus]
MIPVAPVLLTGAAVGGGVTMLVAGLSRGRGDLGDVIARMDANRIDLLAPQQTVQPADWRERLGGWALSRISDSLVRLPRKELAILRESPALQLGKKIGVALYGLLAPALGTAVAVALGAQFPFVIPGVISLVFAVVGWFLVDVNARQRAAEARTEFRIAIASYLDLVSLERAADAGPSEALKRAAQVGDGWVFERIRDALLRAELAGIAPWEGLRQLSEEIDVPELGHPADIIAIAGEEGASVYSTLQAQARSLRGVLLTDQQAHANTASEKMVVPVAALVILMTLYIAAPAMVRVMNS